MWDDWVKKLQVLLFYLLTLLNPSMPSAISSYMEEESSP